MVEEYDEDDPSNQFVLEMMKSKEGDTSALLDMSDIKDDPEDKGSTQIVLARITSSKYDSECEQEETKVYISDVKQSLHIYPKRNFKSLNIALKDAYHSTCFDKESLMSDYPL